MKHAGYRWIMCFLLLGAHALHGGIRESSSGLAGEPVDSIGARIRPYLYRYMEEQGVPGCAVALIRDHRLVWTEGMGKKNMLTGSPVDGETVFEVASNSKIVTAYLALRLVEEGYLALDTPLNGYLDEPWLPGTVYRDSITLRHVLSHSSGLGHNGAGREVQFSPGSGYYYSNLGFIYLQEVIENITGRSLEEAARAWVFGPLAMTSTSYLNPKALRSRLANGHVSGRYTGGMASILLLAPLLLVVLPGVLVHRLVRKRWRPDRKLLRGALLLSFLVWIGAVFALFGLVGWLKYAWLVSLFGTVFILGCALLMLIGRIFRRRAIRWAWYVLVVSGMGYAATRLHHIPVPRWPAIRPMAPASLRTTAGDMAAFLLEVSSFRPLHDSVTAGMMEPQIRLHPQVSWGLGMGIYHSPSGDALWQWGQNVDFLSLTIIYPQSGLGAVVLTNSDWSRPDAAIEIAEWVLGVDLEAVRRASHLEFNTSLGD